MAKQKPVTGIRSGDNPKPKQISGGSTLDSSFDSDAEGESADEALVFEGESSFQDLDKSEVTGREEDDSFVHTLPGDSVDSAPKLIESGLKALSAQAEPLPASARETKRGGEGPTDEEQSADRSVEVKQPAGDYTQTLSHRDLEDEEVARWDAVLAELRAEVKAVRPAPAESLDESIDNKNDSSLSPDSTQNEEVSGFSPAESVERFNEQAASEGLSETRIEPNALDDPELADVRSAIMAAAGIPLEERLQIRMRAIEGGPPFGTASQPEYSVISKLAEGGMGAVYVARQTSLDRKLAIKTLKPMKSRQKEKLEASGRLTEMLRTRREMFLSEAAVTANLVHPNIVSIHDLGETSDGTPYYSMKLVNGSPWNQEIAGQSLEQNIDVLLKVADAVAYAHHCGVINRDLKPENVILGDYGEVVVLDWGLAISTNSAQGTFQTGSSDSTTLGQGTPVYMAPEMLLGPLDEVGVWSDVYLLGAILFEIVTGAPPHEFEQSGGMRAFHRQIANIVGKNVIREVEVEGSSELLEIARKAMQTDRHKRHASVQEFQTAIRSALRHSESERLTQRAMELLEGNPEYLEFQNAIALLEEAVREWPENVRAKDELTQARLSCARRALTKGDHDFGLQLAKASKSDHDSTAALDPEFTSLQKKLQRAKRWRARTRTLIQILGIALLIGFGLIAKQRWENIELNLDAEEAERKQVNAEAAAAAAVKEAEEAEASADVKIAQAAIDTKKAAIDTKKAAIDTKKADDATKLAATKTKQAAIDTEKALDATTQAAIDTKKADDATKLAAIKTADADAAVLKAKLQAQYAAKAGPAEGFMRLGEYSKAIRLFEEILELNDISRLQRGIIDEQLKEAKKRASKASGPIETGAVSRDGRTFVYADNQGRVYVHQADLNAKLIAAPIANFNVGGVVNSVEVAAGGEWVAAAVSGNGPNGHTVEIRDVAAGQLGKQRILSGFAGDVTALTTAHQSEWLVTGDKAGTVRIYRASTGALLSNFETIQRTKIDDLAMLPNGRQIVVLSGTNCFSLSVSVTKPGAAQAGNVTIAQGQQLKLPSNQKIPGIRKAFARAVVSPDGQMLGLAQGSRVILLRRNPNPDEDGFPFMSPMSLEARECVLQAHLDTVNDLAFSTDGKQLVTASNDYLVKLWDLQNPNQAAPATHMEQFHGHGGFVTSCGFLAGTARVVSMSQDFYVRYWDLETYKNDRGELERLLDANPINEAIAKEQKEVALRLVEPADDLESESQSAVATSLPRLTKPWTGIFRTTSFQSDSEPSAPIVLKRHQGPVKSVRLSRDGQKLITGGQDRTARLWNAKNGKPLTGPDGLPRVFQADPALEEGHRFNAAQIQYLPGRHGLLLTTGYDATVSIWNASIDQPGAGHQIARLRDVGLLNAVAATMDGELLMTSAAPEGATTSGGAKLWNIDAILTAANPEPIRRFPGIDQKPVSAVAVSPNKSRFAVGTRGGTLAIWNGPTDEPAFLQRQAHNQSAVSATEFIDDSQLLTAGVDGQVILWKLEEDSDQLSVTTKRIYEHGTGTTVGAVTQLALSPDRRQFLTVTYPPKQDEAPQSLHLWNVDNAAVDRRIPLKQISASSTAVKGITSVKWSSNGSRAAAVVDGVLRIFETEQWKLVSRLTYSTARSADLEKQAVPTGVAFPPDQDTPENLATFDGYRAHVWNLDGGTHVASFRPHATVLAADYSADGKFVVTGSRSLRIFNGDHRSTDYGKSLFKKEQPHAGPVSTAVFAPGEGSYRFVSASNLGSATVWEWSPIEKQLLVIRQLEGHEGGVNGAAWSEDAKHLLTVGDDGRPRLWDVDAADAEPLVFEIENPEKYDLYCCAISSDGKRVAVGGIETLSKNSVGWVWKKSGDDYLLHCKVGDKHAQEGITAMTFIPETDLIVTGGGDSEVYLSFLPEEQSEQRGPTEFNIDLTAKLVGEGRNKAHAAKVTAVSADASGRVVTSSDDGEVIIWSYFVDVVRLFLEEKKAEPKKAADPAEDGSI